MRKENLLERIEFEVTEEQLQYINQELEGIEIAEDETLEIKNTGMTASNGELIEQVVLTNGDMERHVCYI